MSSTMHSYNENTLFEFEDKHINVNDKWDFLNGEPIIIKQFVHKNNFKFKDNPEYLIDVYPSDPRYVLSYGRYKDPKEVKQAYEFLKDRVYIGYFCDDEWGPCNVHCYVDKHFVYSNNVLEYAEEIWPSSPNRKFFYYPQINEPVIKYKGSLY